MKKNRHWVIMLIVVCFITVLPASRSAALETIQLGPESELTVYGWLRNNLGMFTDKISYTQSGNVLATCRTWLRTYFDYKVADNLRMWAAIQFVHEPWYHIETGATSSSSTHTGRPVLKDGKEYSEYYRLADLLRELYMDYEINKNNSLRVGRQILIWGESLTTRVNDLIHPEDTRFTFAFANLEDTRIPLWMIKGLHQFPGINSGIEWLFSFNLDDAQYRVNRSGNFPQPNNVGVLQPGQRFGLYPEDRGRPGAPLDRSFTYVAAIDAWLPIGLVDPTAPERGFEVVTEYPKRTLQDSRFGLRTNTFWSGAEFGMIYFHTQAYSPVFRRARSLTPDGTRIYTLTYPNLDYFGLWMNYDLPVGLTRVEAVYSPNKPYVTFNTSVESAQVRRDYIKYMVCYDLSGFFYFNWKKDSAIDVSIEHVGEVVPDNQQLQYAIYNTNIRQWVPSFNGRIATTWNYGKLDTQIIVSYAPKDNSGLFMPIVKYTPSIWNKAFSFEVRYIRIFADSNYEGLGLLQQKDMVVLTSQLNF